MPTRKLSSELMSRPRYDESHLYFVAKGVVRGVTKVVVEKYMDSPLH